MNKAILLMSIVFSCVVSGMEIEHELGIAKFDQPPTRVIALNWGVTETMLALGVNPIGIADIEGYKTWVNYPKLPEKLADIGTRREPNLEAIKALEPDLILISKEMTQAFEQLNNIAPTVAVSVFTNNKQPLIAAKEMTRIIGAILGKNEAAETLITQTDNNIADHAKSISTGMEPLLFIRFLSERTVRVHGQGSLLDDTIRQMGLTNIWDAKTNMWGFTKVGVSKLARYQNARVMVIGPLSESEQLQLKSAKLWQLMAFSKEDRVHILPAIWTYGGLIAAQRFSQQIALSLAE